MCSAYDLDVLLTDDNSDGDISAAIAQLGERQTEDLKVPGSIPGLGIFLMNDCSLREC